MDQPLFSPKFTLFLVVSLGLCIWCDFARHVDAQATPPPMFGTAYKNCDGKFYIRWTGVPARVMVEGTTNGGQTWHDVLRVDVIDGTPLNTFEWPISDTGKQALYRLRAL